MHIADNAQSIPRYICRKVLALLLMYDCRTQNIMKKIRRRPKPRYSIHFLREWREKQNMGRRQLANQTGMAPQTIGRIENRQIQLTQETIDAFARVLKIPRGAIFERPPHNGQ